MKKLLSRLLSLSLILCLCVSFFGGCAPDEKGKGETPTPPTQAELNQKATDAIVGAGMGMLINGEKTSATADIQVTDASSGTKVFSLTNGVLKIKGSPSTESGDIEVYFGSSTYMPEIGSADIAITLFDEILYVKSGDVMLKADSADINSIFAMIIGLIASGDAETAMKSAVTSGNLEFSEFLGDSTYSETADKVQIVLSVNLDMFGQDLTESQLKINVTLNKGNSLSFEKISINQTIGGNAIDAEVSFATDGFDGIAAPTDADKYTNLSVYISELLPEVAQALFLTMQKQSFELNATASIHQETWDADGVIGNEPSPLLELDLDALIERKQEDVAALIDYKVGGLAAMMLPEQNQIYIPSSSEPFVYVTETKGTVASKVAMTGEDYLGNLSSMSDMLPLMGLITGLDFTFNTNIYEMLSVVKTVTKSVSNGVTSFAIELDMLKLLPNNANADGESNFIEQKLNLVIGADGLLKSISASIMNKVMDDSGEAMGGTIKFAAELTKTDNVVVNAPEGFNKNDYAVVYSQFKDIKINSKTMINKVVDGVIELDVLKSDTTVTINPTLVNSSKALLTINGKPIATDFVYQLTGDENRFVIKATSIDGLFDEKTVTVIIRRTLP